MNKKAQAEIAWKTLYFIIIGVMLSILAISLTMLFLIHSNSQTKIDPKIESQVLSARFINSPNCFAYQDPITERVYPGLIELNRFNNEVIQDCYITSTTKQYQFQLKLIDSESKQEIIIQTKEWYNNPSFTLTQPVQIKKQNEILNGQLLIFVQKPISS